MEKLYTCVHMYIKISSTIPYISSTIPYNLTFTKEYFKTPK